MTRYRIFDELSTLCEMEKTGENQYNKMIQSGELVKTHHDYGVGYYDVCIYYLYARGHHQCRIWFGTIDDGCYGAWTQRDTKEEVVELIEKARDIFNDMVVAPSHDDLNLLFRNLGIYFCNE